MTGIIECQATPFNPDVSFGGAMGRNNYSNLWIIKGN